MNRNWPKRLRRVQRTTCPHCGGCGLEPRLWVRTLCRRCRGTGVVYTPPRKDRERTGDVG